MTSIYRNLRNSGQYKAYTGMSLEEFTLLFSSFEKVYIPKTPNPYATTNMPVLTDKRDALFYSTLLNIVSNSPEYESVFWLL